MAGNPVSDLKVGSLKRAGYQASHRIPQQFAKNNSFLDQLKQATPEAGNPSRLFDIQSARANGQLLPSSINGYATVPYVDASQHLGSHPRIDDFVRQQFLDWEAELESGDTHRDRRQLKNCA